MSNFIPAAPGTLALIAYSHDDINDGYNGIGIIETVVFALKIVEEPTYSRIEPVTQSEFDLGPDEIGPALEMPDGKVVWDNEVFVTRSGFEHHCSWIFDRRREAAKEKAERKAIEDLL